MRFVLVFSNWAMLRQVDVFNMQTSSRGLTGSETSFYRFASELASRGHDVTTFSPIFTEGLHEGVTHRNFTSIEGWKDENWDVAVAWIDPRPLRQFTNVRLKVLNQQVNDFVYCPGWEEYIDVITSPADAHRQYLMGLTRFRKNWIIVPNGCDRTWSPNDENRESKMLLYASSPDRGLHWLLEMYPEIHRLNPDVQLHIYYDFDRTYQALRYVDTEIAYRIRYCHEMIGRLKRFGVSHHKSASKVKIFEEMRRATVLTYPCDTVSFTEGFSVTTLEAASLGAVPLITPVDALKEIYGGHVPMISGQIADRKEEYVEHLDRLLNDELYRKQCQLSSWMRSRDFVWSDVVSKFEEDLTQILGRK